MMHNDQLLYLSRADVEATGVSMRQIIDALGRAFRIKGEGRVEMPPKPGIHPRADAFIHAMPAYIPGLEAAGVKWVSGYPQNQAKGLPYITGLLILNDADTGVPMCVMDCTWITAMRTGAATALAAKYLARQDSATLGILGCGVQGHSNLLAVREVCQLTQVRAYDIDIDRTRQFAEHYSRELDIPITPATSPREAVEGMDIVVTAGPILRQPHETIQADWLSPGAFVSPIDFDSYFTRDALRRADTYLTDDVTQYQYYKQAGYFQDTPKLNGEIAHVICGQHVGRKSPDAIVFCINLGLALDDIAVAPMVHQRAIEAGLGTWLQL